MTPLRLITLALLATLLAMPGCGRRGDPIRPAPRAGEQPVPLPTPPIPPQPPIDESTTPEGEEVF